MKKHLDLEYMREAVLKVKTGIRAGKNDKPKKPKKDDPVITPKYGITPEPIMRYAILPA